MKQKEMRFVKIASVLVMCLLGIRGVKAQGDCPDIVSLNAAAVNRCIGAIEYNFKVNEIYLPTSYDKSDFSFQIDWGDGTPIKTITGTDTEIVNGIVTQTIQDNGGGYWETVRFNKKFPDPGAATCYYQVKVQLVLKGQQCGFQSAAIAVWGRDDQMRAEMRLRDQETGERIVNVCEGAPVDVTFVDVTEVNCNIWYDDEQPQRNNSTRTIEFIYGAGGTAFPNGTEIGGTASMGNDITFGTNSVTLAYGTGQMSYPSRNIKIPAGKTTAGEKFIVQLNNTNTCGAAAPTTAEIHVVEKPPTPTGTGGGDFCYGATITAASITAPPSNFTKGEYKWYFNTQPPAYTPKTDSIYTASQALNSSAAHTFNPTTNPFKNGFTNTTSGVYNYYVTYTFTQTEPHCASDPQLFTWTVRENLTKPGTPTVGGSKTYYCPGDQVTLTLPAAGSGTPGGAAKYIWRVVTGLGTGYSTAATLSATTGSSVSVTLDAEPAATATTTIRIGVVRQYENNPDCPTEETTIDFVVNPKPLATLKYSSTADVISGTVCADDPIKLYIRNLAGSGNPSTATNSRNFDVYMNYAPGTSIGVTGITNTTNSKEIEVPSTVQANGTITNYYIYKVVDTRTGCESVRPSATATTEITGSVVTVIKRPKLTGDINVPADNALYCAGATLAPTATPANAPTLMTITGVNVSTGAATTSTPSNTTVNSQYVWTVQGLTAQTSNTPSFTLQSGTDVPASGLKREVKLAHQFTDVPRCDVTTTREITVVPLPTARFQPNTTINICEDLDTYVEITTTGYTAGADWVVGWELSKTGSTYTKTGTVDVTNPSASGSSSLTNGNGYFKLDLLKGYFAEAGFGNAYGVYKITLTSVRQNNSTTANCSGTITPSTSFVTINITPGPRVTLSGDAEVCQGYDHTIPATSFQFQSGVASNYAIVYEIGGAERNATLTHSGSSGANNNTASVTIDKDDIGASDKTVTIKSITQVGGAACPGWVGSTNRYDIELIAYPQPPVITTPDTNHCGEDLPVVAEAVINTTDYTGTWSVFSATPDPSPLYGTFDGPTDKTSNNHSTTFYIPTNGYGKYVLEWSIAYTGSGTACPPANTYVELTFGTEPSEPFLENTEPVKICGHQETLVIMNTLEPWEWAEWAFQTPTDISDFSISPDPNSPDDDRRIIASINNRKDGILTLEYTIKTSCTANYLTDPNKKTVDVEFVGKPTLVMTKDPGSFDRLCPYDAENTSTDNQFLLTLVDSKSLPNVGYTWSVSPSFTTTGNSTSTVAFDAPANNTGKDVIYTINGRITRTRSGVSCPSDPGQYLVTVKPKPVIETIGNLNLCPGDDISARIHLRNAIEETNPAATMALISTQLTYNWTNNGPQINAGLVDFSESVSGVTLGNSTNYPLSANTIVAGLTNNKSGGTSYAEINDIEIYAIRDGCQSVTREFTLTVNPQPEPYVVTAPGDLIYCPGDRVGTDFSAPEFSCDLENADYHWTYEDDISGERTGSHSGDDGNILTSFTAVRNEYSHNVKGTVYMTSTGWVTSSISGKECTKTNNFKITVKPQPVMPELADHIADQSLCAFPNWNTPASNKIGSFNEIIFSVSNRPSDIDISEVSYTWENLGDDGIIGADYTSSLVSPSTQVLSTTNAINPAGIFDIAVPGQLADDLDRVATIRIYPKMNGCYGDYVDVERTAHALPKLTPIVDLSPVMICPTQTFDPVTFTSAITNTASPAFKFDRVVWSHSTIYGTGSIGLGAGPTSITANSSSESTLTFTQTAANQNITGDLITGEITVHAVKDYGALRCYGAPITFERTVKPTPVLEEIVQTPLTGKQSVCPGEDFSELVVTSLTTDASFQPDIIYTWKITTDVTPYDVDGSTTYIRTSDAVLMPFAVDGSNVKMPSSGTGTAAAGGNIMPSYEGGENLNGVSYVRRVTFSATLNGCPSNNTPHILLTLKPQPVMKLEAFKLHSAFVSANDRFEFCPDANISLPVIGTNIAGTTTPPRSMWWNLVADPSGDQITTDATIQDIDHEIKVVSTTQTVKIPDYTANANFQSGVAPRNIEGKYTIWAEVNGCWAEPEKFDIIIKPTPDIILPFDLSNTHPYYIENEPIFLCDGETMDEIRFFSERFPGGNGWPEATYVWSRAPQNNIGNVAGFPSDQLPSNNTTSTWGPNIATLNKNFVPSFRAYNPSTNKQQEVSSIFSVRSLVNGCYSHPPEVAPTFTVTIGAKPIVNTINNLTVCANKPVTFPDFTFTPLSSPSVTYTSSDVEWYWSVTNVQLSGGGTKLPLVDKRAWAEDLLLIPFLDAGMTSQLESEQNDNKITSFTPDWDASGGYTLLYGTQYTTVLFEHYVTLKESSITGEACKSDPKTFTLRIDPLPETTIRKESECVVPGPKQYTTTAMPGNGSYYKWWAESSSDPTGVPKDPANPLAGDYDYTDFEPVCSRNSANCGGGIPCDCGGKEEYYMTFIYPPEMLGNTWKGSIFVQETNSFGCTAEPAEMIVVTVPTPQVEIYFEPNTMPAICSGEQIQVFARVDGKDGLTPADLLAMDHLELAWFPNPASISPETDTQPWFTGKSINPVSTGVATQNIPIYVWAIRGDCPGPYSNTITYTVYSNPVAPQLSNANPCAANDEWPMTARATHTATGTDRVEFLWHRMDGNIALPIEEEVGLGNFSPVNVNRVDMKDIAGFRNKLPDNDWIDPDKINYDRNVYYEVSHLYTITRDYNGKDYSLTCESDPIQRELTIRVSPEIPIIDNSAAWCYSPFDPNYPVNLIQGVTSNIGGSAPVGATPGARTSLFRWYDIDTGGSIKGISQEDGSGVLQPWIAPLSSADISVYNNVTHIYDPVRIYWVSAVSASNCESPRVPIPLTVYPLPDAPTLPNESYCAADDEWLMTVTDDPSLMPPHSYLRWERIDGITGYPIYDYGTTDLVELYEVDMKNTVDFENTLPVTVVPNLPLMRNTTIRYSVRRDLEIDHEYEDADGNQLTKSLTCSSANTDAQMILLISPDIPINNVDIAYCETPTNPYYMISARLPSVILGNNYSLRWYEFENDTEDNALGSGLLYNVEQNTPSIPDISTSSGYSEYELWVETVAGSCTSDRLRVPYVVFPLPDIDFKLYDQSGDLTLGGCSSFTFRATNTSPEEDRSKYTWSFLQGATIPAYEWSDPEKSVIRTYSAAGSDPTDMTVRLSAVSKNNRNYNAPVGSGFCYNDISKSLTVYPKPTPPIILNTIRCANDDDWEMVANFTQTQNDADMRWYLVESLVNSMFLEGKDHIVDMKLNPPGGLPVSIDPITFNDDRTVNYKVSQVFNYLNYSYYIDPADETAGISTKKYQCESDLTTTGGLLTLREFPNAPSPLHADWCEDVLNPYYTIGAAKGAPVAKTSSLRWFETETSSALIGSGENLTVQSASKLISSNPPVYDKNITSYWVQAASSQMCISDRVEVKLTVFPLPNIDFKLYDYRDELTLGGCAPFEVTAKNISLDTDGSEYQWEFELGVPLTVGFEVWNPAGNSATYEYIANGTTPLQMKVKLTARSLYNHNYYANDPTNVAFCESSKTKDLTIYPTPPLPTLLAAEWCLNDDKWNMRAVRTQNNTELNWYLDSQITPFLNMATNVTNLTVDMKTQPNALPLWPPGFNSNAVVDYGLSQVFNYENTKYYADPITETEGTRRLQCESNPTSSTLTLHVVPDLPTPQGVAYCQTPFDPNYLISAIPGNNTSSLRWFDSQTSIVQRGNGDDYLAPQGGSSPLDPSSPTGYKPFQLWVDAVSSNGLCRSARVPVPLIIYPQPIQPSLPSKSYCSDETTWEMTATLTEPAAQNPYIAWYRFPDNDMNKDPEDITYKIGGANVKDLTVDMLDISKYDNTFPPLFDPNNVTKDEIVMYAVSQLIDYPAVDGIGDPTGVMLACESRNTIAQLSILVAPDLPEVPLWEELAYCENRTSPMYQIHVNSRLNTAGINWFVEDAAQVSGYRRINSGVTIPVTIIGSSTEKTAESPGVSATYEPFYYYAQAIGLNSCPTPMVKVPLTVYPLPKLDLELEVQLADGSFVKQVGGCSPYDQWAKNLSPSAFADYSWQWKAGEATVPAPRYIHDPSDPDSETYRRSYKYEIAGTLPEPVFLKLTGVSTVNHNPVMVNGAYQYCASERDTMILIQPGVKASFYVSEADGCDPLSVIFTGSVSSGAYRYRWYWDTPNPPDYEPGKPVLPVDHLADNDPANDKYYGISSPNPINVFVNDRNSSDPREYHVWLQVDNGMCHDNKDTVVVVYPSPHTKFSHNLANNTICPPLPVIFTNESEGAAYPGNTYRTQYEWNFGDGTVETLPFGTGTQSHIFTSLNESAPKNYTIWMTAFNTYPSEVVSGKQITCRTTTSQNIYVNPEVKADFSLPVAGCSPLPVRFQNQSFGAVSYLDWNFGDGTNSIEQNPTHTYPHIVGSQIETYTITLTAGNTFGCKDVISKSFRLNPQPVATFEVDNSQGCQPMTVTFFNTSNTSAGSPNPTDNMTYLYDFNDAWASPPIFDDRDVEHVFTNTLGRELSIKPTLTVINGWGCTNTSDPRQITIFPYVGAHFEMEDSIGCSPLKIRFRNGAQGYDEFVYIFGDGNMTDGDRTSNPLHTHTFVNPSMYRDTVYFVTLKVTAGSGCTADTTRKVTILASPVADFVPPAPYPAAYPYPSPPLLMENRIRLPDRRKLDYQWSWADQGGYLRTFSRNESPGPPPISTWGVFDIMQHVTAPNGKCSDSIMRTITITPPPPRADFEEVPPGCMPYTVKFENTSRYAVSYKWDFGDRMTDNSESPEHTYGGPGEYTVVLTAIGYDMSVSTFSRTVTVYPMPQANFQISHNFLYAGQALRVNNYTSHTYSTGKEYEVWYKWDWGDKSPNDTIYQPSHMYYTPGKYYITLTTGTYTNPQCISTLTNPDPVELQKFGDVLLPNVFKPSPDGEPDNVIPNGGYRNNLFYPPVISSVSKYLFVVYNRWGQKLFETTDFTRGWNGYFNGNLCPEGIYYYRIEGTFENGQSFSKIGDITLIR